MVNKGLKIFKKIILLQVSLSSTHEADFRFSAIFAQIGVYRGRIYAVKKSVEPVVDINRKLKKELKVCTKVTT